MITVVIIAILSSVALPSYQSYVQKGRRLDGTSALMAVQLEQEKYRSRCPSYAKSLGASTGCDDKVSYPTTSELGYYNIAIASANSISYSITATPVAGKSQENDSCSTLSITVNGSNITYGPNNKCWGK